MLFMQLPSFSKTSGFSNHLHNYIITCVYGRKKETEEQIHLNIDLSARNSKVIDLTPKRDGCSYSSGYQAPGKILW